MPRGGLPHRGGQQGHPPHQADHHPGRLIAARRAKARSRLADDLCTSAVPREVKRPWRDYEDIFAVELLDASHHVRMLYADHERVILDATPGCCEVDGAGNPVACRGGHRYMHFRADWHRVGYDDKGRFRQLEQEGERFARERWKAEGNRFMLFASTYLWPYVPGLRAFWHRWHRSRRHQIQLYELVREIAVLRTILELERKQGSGSGGGGKPRRITLSSRLPSHAAPTSLALH